MCIRPLTPFLMQYLLRYQSSVYTSLLSSIQILNFQFTCLSIQCCGFMAKFWRCSGIWGGGPTSRPGSRLEVPNKRMGRNKKKLRMSTCYYLSISWGLQEMASDCKWRERYDLKLAKGHFFSHPIVLYKHLTSMKETKWQTLKIFFKKS